MSGEEGIFDCFGDESDCDDDEVDGEDVRLAKGGSTSSINAPSTATAIRKRPADCGVLAFHAGTERSLLVFVRNALLEQRLLKQVLAPQQILKIVDRFCHERHWMMHIGPEKAGILKTFVRDCVKSWRLRSSSGNSNNNSNIVAPRSFTLLELGTYCGYSAIQWACHLQEELEKDESFHIFTVEVNKEFISVAQQLVDLAGMSCRISIVPLEFDILSKTITALPDALKANGVPRPVEFLFLDHDKDAYSTDLKVLEGSGHVQSGTHVAADNVLFAHIHEYRTYMRSLVEKKMVISRLEETRLEYSSSEQNVDSTLVCDGIELSVYVSDPIRSGAT